MNKETIVTDRQTMIDLMMQSINSGMQMQAEQQSKFFPLKSLFFPEHRRKYIVGDQVLIKEGALINSQGVPTTHEITLLEGLLNDSKHRITVKDLSTNEVQTIEL